MSDPVIRGAAGPIIVSNTFWQAADPEAYDGGKAPTTAHLAVAASGGGRRDRLTDFTHAVTGAHHFVPASETLALCAAATAEPG